MKDSQFLELKLDIMKLSHMIELEQNRKYIPEQHLYKMAQRFEAEEIELLARLTAARNREDDQ